LTGAEELGATDPVTSFAYNKIDQVTKVTLPDGSFLSYTYGPGRRLTLVENNAGERIEYTYNFLGNVTAIKVKDSSGAIVESQTRTFDELGRLLRLIGASAQDWTHSWDKADNLVEVEDPRGNVFSYAYDGLNRLIRIVDEDGSETDVTLTGRGDVATLADPNLVVTSYVRNGWGEAIRESSPDVGTTDYVRNALGLITQKTDGRGYVSNYAYDDAGRLTAITYPASAGENTTYAYDSVTGGNEGKGRLTFMSTGSGNTKFTYDLRGLLTTAAHTIDANVYVVSYDYDSAGRLTEIVYPSGRIVTYTYDTSGRLSGVAFRRGASYPLVQLASDIETRPFSGTLVSFTHATGLVESRTFDNDGRVTSYGVKDGATDRLKKTLAYADDINLTGVTDVLDATKNETYGYTASNRLEDTTGPWGDEDFAYDGVGNRISRVATSGGVTTSDATTLASGTNRLASISTNGTTSRTFTHNGAGYLKTDTKSGVTTTYTYYHSGRLSNVSVGGAGRGPYRYNAFARLVSRQVTSGAPASTIHMIYDEQGNLVAEADSTTGQVMREYAWIDGRPLAVWKDVDTAGPIRYHVHVDHLDRPVMMTNVYKAVVWQAIYKPFGEVHSITGSAAFDYRFPGQWFMLETGLHYNWHRWYDASLGRYTQPDPLGMPAGPSRYAYARNSPLMYIDPDGQDPTARILRDLLQFLKPGPPANDNPRRGFCSSRISRAGQLEPTLAPLKDKPTAIMCVLADEPSLIRS
jgi:RHS repeat-associated protein